MKIVTVLGARPQFIKAASLSYQILNYNDISEVIIHTGQHFDENMSRVFFEEMKIPMPKYNLNINSLSHGAMTGRMLEGIEEILLIEKPDWVVVYGDTNSTIAGSLAAKKLNIKVAHIEAGLRSFDIKMPEEINRILTDQISDILFCPTQTAINNLNNEGFANKKDVEIIECGDIMFESALRFRSKRKEIPNIEAGFILATIHRQENTDDDLKLTQIIKTFNELIALGNKIVMPLHPRTKKCIERHDLPIDFEVINPVGYLEMIYLLENCSMVITDSGGLQKEAYFFNKFCITLRESTEWIELIEHGANVLFYPDHKLTENILSLLDRKLDNSSSLYGDGDSSRIILESLIAH